jgi:hypothetical protein
MEKITAGSAIEAIVTIASFKAIPTAAATQGVIAVEAPKVLTSTGTGHGVGLVGAIGGWEIAGCGVGAVVIAALSPAAASSMGAVVFGEDLKGFRVGAEHLFEEGELGRRE